MFENPPYPLLITGAAGGLGRALSVEAARRGWSLILTDRPETKLDDLAKALKRSYGIGVQTVFCDLTDATARVLMFQRLQEKIPHLGGLVNVAGVDFEGTFEELNPQEVQTIVRLNIEATLDVTMRTLALRDKRQRFLLITISSLAAFYPMPVKATYAASKRFLLDFFRALKAEMRHENIHMTVVCPAGMPTTPGAIKGIELQGFWGHVTTVESGTVATEAFDHVLKGKFLYIPGRINQVLQALSSLVPPSSLAAYVAWRWRKNKRSAGI